MEHIPEAAWLTEAVSAAARHGAGNLLRVVLVVSVVGAVLRGYRGGGGGRGDE